MVAAGEEGEKVVGKEVTTVGWKRICYTVLVFIQHWLIITPALLCMLLLRHWAPQLRFLSLLLSLVLLLLQASS